MSATILEVILTLISVFCAATLGYLLASGKAWFELERLRAAVRRHRDDRGDDRCWLDDEVLYAALPEGYSPPARDTTIELANCARFIASRQNPVTEYVSPNVEIDRLRDIVKSLAERAHCQSELLSARAEKSPSSADGPEVITLCGSTRFVNEYIAAQRRLTLQGKIVISVGLFGHQEGLDMASETKAMLDWLHLRKIDHSHSIYIINVGGYIGESTGREIAHARATGKRIYWLETPPGEPNTKPAPHWRAAGKPPAAIIKTCHSHKDGDCDWQDCPQQRDGEPGVSGRHCPLDVEDQQ